MLVRKTCILFLFAALLGAGSLRAQQLSVEARIAGLESNEEYMSLLREDAQLQMREDSIVNAVERARRQLRENPAARQQYSQDILQLESRIFEIRNAKGRLIDRINTIEQEWVLANLNGAASQPAGPAAENPAAEIPDSLKVRNLVSNPYFREQLPEADYAALVEAQRLEFDAVDYVNRYFANYGTISELAEAYAAAQAEADAAEIYDKYKTLQGFNRVLADSLRGVTAQLEGIDFRLPRIDVAERYFLDYDSVSFSSTPKYSYQHPIPECKVYEHGTIYRILLGTFNTKRAVSTFRGAYPLSYLVNDDRKWCYYAGGFATREEAEAAQKLLKARGFVRPEIVVWTDGEYRNLSKDPEAQHIAYRVEIVSSEALSDAVKAAITDTAEGCELSRVGQQLFVVGTFDDKAVADRVAAAVTQTDPALEIKVAEIAE